MASFIDSYIQQLKSYYPSLANETEIRAKLENVVTDKMITLPTAVYRLAQTSIQKLFQYTHSSHYDARLEQELSAHDKAILHAPLQNKSVLMAYDFHYEDGDSPRLSLIEINTNASAFLLSAELYRHLQDVGGAQSALTALRESFLKECCFLKTEAPNRAIILDETPSLQKMYPEFLMYRDLMTSWGWPAEIQDTRHHNINAGDFVYNRFNDFTFNQPNSKTLLEAYLSGRALFSPNPKEYIRLADKQRLVDLSLKNVCDTAIPTLDVRAVPNRDDLWAKRKNLFFKPKNLYGGKAAYKGSSISRNVFDNVVNENFIAQEYRPAGTWSDFKFDLRFYVYEDQIQLCIARLYKGQLTNFGTLGGGLACVKFI